MKINRGNFILVYLVLSFLIFSTVTGDDVGFSSVSSGDFKSPPINPQFLKYIESNKEIKTSGVLEHNKFGEIPSPVNNQIKDVQMFDVGVDSYASSFDLRNSGKISSVKNQNPWGTCWSFATFGSLESTLMPGETWDFSEKNLINLAGFDYSIPGSGNAYMSTAYLSRWNGPVTETTDPYPNPYGSWLSSSSYSPVKHVQKVVFFPGRSSYTDNDNFKGALINFGAVYSSLWWDDANYNSATYAYYEPVSFSESTETGGGHAVTIVGWNDDYPASNFVTTPPGNGAWIVKNSWGSSWGDGGYFYVSYYDRRFASKYQPDYVKESAVFICAPTTTYQTVYSYDPLGWVSNYGYDGVLTSCFANVFTASSPGTVNAVGFYTVEPDAQYSVSIYKNPSSLPAGGTPVVTFSGVLPYMGYNTVNVPSGITLNSGDVFSVAVTVTNPSYPYLICVQQPFPGYSSGSTGSPGHGYYKSGSGFTWYDITDEITNSAICLKAYVSSTPSSGSLDNIGVFRGAGLWYLDHDGSQSWTADDLNWIKSFGLSSDIPVAGDWNGDGKKELGVYRQGIWYLDHDGSNSWTTDDLNWIKFFGLPGDIPVAGDWNGDGIDELGVYRQGLWYLDHDASYSWTADDLYWIKAFGLSGDIPVVGDWNGDRVDELGVYRGAGWWYLDHDASYSWTANDLNWIKAFGLSGDIPVVGDWNSDKVDEIGVYRQGLWYLDHDASYSWTGDDLNWIKAFGLPYDTPVVGVWSVWGTTSVESEKEKINAVFTPPDVSRPVAAVPKVDIPVKDNNQPGHLVNPAVTTKIRNPLVIGSSLIPH